MGRPDSPRRHVRSLFEALNWAVSLDDRLAQAWPEEPGNDRHQQVMCATKVRAPRYARNSVHHDWARAIELPKTRCHLPARQVMEEWTWPWPLPTKTPRYEDRVGEREYRQRLVGQPVFLTLGRSSRA